MNCCDPGYRRLAAAIVARAIRDVRERNRSANEALLWLMTSPLAVDLLDGLDVHIDRLWPWIGTQWRELTA